MNVTVRAYEEAELTNMGATYKAKNEPYRSCSQIAQRSSEFFVHVV